MRCSTSKNILAANFYYLACSNLTSLRNKIKKINFKLWYRLCLSHVYLLLDEWVMRLECVGWSPFLRIK